MISAASLNSDDEVSKAVDDDVHTVGVHSAKDSVIRMRDYVEDEVPKSVLDFSDVSSPRVISSLCVQHIPGWTELEMESVVITQLLEGLSNQLFKVAVPAGRRLGKDGGSPKDYGGLIECALFRVYGKDASTFYDPDYEYRVFQMLARYRIAPQMFASGDGWRIEEWHQAVAVPNRLMSNPSISLQVASHLGRLHKLQSRYDFPQEFRTEAITLTRLNSWPDSALRAASKLASGSQENRRQLDQLRLQDICDEAAWLKDLLLAQDHSVNGQGPWGQGMDVVFSHNDAQENNVLQTQYGLRLIDFEYAGCNYQAFDIANWFCEFTIDYTEKQYPYYSTNLAAYPSLELQRLFASAYLSEYLESTVLPSDDSFVLPLLDNVSKFSLVSHLLWALWSVVCAPQAATYEEFPFLHYAKFRFDAYKRLKMSMTDQATGLFPRKGSDNSALSSRSMPAAPVVVVREASRQMVPAPQVVLPPIQPMPGPAASSSTEVWLLRGVVLAIFSSLVGAVLAKRQL